MGLLTLETSLDDRYVVQELLGAGASTEVYRAEDRKTGRQVAIKILIGNRLYERATDRFGNEATVMAKIEHDGVVQILAVGQANARSTMSGPLPSKAVGEFSYIVMEYIEAGTLRKRLLSDTPMSLHEIEALGQRLALAIGVVHQHGLVHGDVKPENIYLPDGDVRRAKLGDFGLVDMVSPQTGVTQTGVILGTPLYMSPEQILGQSRSFVSDVWMLGMVLYECAYGQLPFGHGSDSVYGLMREIIDKTLTFEPLGKGLHQVLAQALAKRPADRFPSMSAFASALGSHAAQSLDISRGTPDDRYDTHDRQAPAPAPTQGQEGSLTFDLQRARSDPGSEAASAASGPRRRITFDTEVILPNTQPAKRSDARTRWHVLTMIVLVVGVATMVTFGLGEGLNVHPFVPVVTSSLLAALLVFGLLSGLERRALERADTLATDAEQFKGKAHLSQVLSRSIALTLDSLLTESAVEPAIDLRRASLALAIDDFQLAKDRDDQRQALERAIVIADKLREQMQHRVRPWYVQHKEVLTIVTALLAAVAALVSSIAGALQSRP